MAGGHWRSFVHMFTATPRKVIIDILGKLCPTILSDEAVK